MFMNPVSMNNVTAASPQVPAPAGITPGAAAKTSFQLQLDTAIGAPAIANKGNSGNDEPKVSLSNAGIKKQAQEQQVQPAEKTPFKPWDAGCFPPWVDAFGLSLPVIGESALEYDRRNAKYLSLSGDEKQSLYEGIAKHFGEVLEENNLSSDNPRSHELLFENKVTSEQYHQQYKQRVDADPKLLAILVKLGLRTAKAG